VILTEKIHRSLLIKFDFCRARLWQGAGNASLRHFSRMHVGKHFAAFNLFHFLLALICFDGDERFFSERNEIIRENKYLFMLPIPVGARRGAENFSNNISPAVEHFFSL
jgi:hypothetical protein